MWGEDITIIPTYENRYSTMPYGLVNVTGSVNPNSSSEYVAGSNGGSFTVTFTTTKSDIYIESITFNSVSNGTLTPAEGDGSISENVLTASDDKTSVSVTMKSDNSKKGKFKISNIVISTGSNTVETLSAFSVSSGSISATAKVDGTTVTSAVSMTTDGASASDGILSLTNNKSITFTSSNNIKYIAIFNKDNKADQSNKFQVGNTKLTGAVWEGSEKSITIKNATGAARTISYIYVITEEDATSGGGDDPEPSCTTPTIAWATGSTANITAINELAATDFGIDVANYTGNITWTLTGDDIVELSNEGKTGCTVTGKADSYGTATLTASFTLSEDATLCDGTYSISKTIKIVQCTEPAALANEIARFQVPCLVDNTKTLDTYETADYTCTLSGIGGNGNWWQDPNTNLWYAKFSGNYAGNYVKIKLKSGSFKAGDVVTIAVNRNNTTKDGVWIKGNTANTHHQIVPGSTASGVEALGTYTLVASDIEDDGSLSFYRISSNTYVNRIIVTRCAQPEISLQPEGVSLAVGDENPTLSFTATGATSYAWKESSDGTSYDGESALVTTANYTPSVNDVVQTKYYYCELTNACGTVKTDIVTVNVAASINYYTVTLVPAGGTIDDATGWTLNAGNYEKEVAEGTELTLPTFTKENRTFKTWRNAVPEDVTSPITVNGNMTLTAVWAVTVETVIYSWEGKADGATEVGGTAATVSSGADNFINIAKGGYYCLQISGGTSYDKYVEITLSGDEKVKTGDKIKYWGFYYKDSNANARPKMRDGNSPNAQIFDDPNNLPNLNGGGDPVKREFTVPADINTNKVQITRTQTGSNTWIPKLQIIREQQVEEADLRTVTFNSNGGSNIAAVQVASGQAVAKPADPTRAGYRFIKWQKSGVDYDFSTAVTVNCTLDAVWQQIWTVTFNANGGSEVAAVIVDNGQIVAEPAAPTRGKYTFLGWFVGDTDDAYDFSAAVTSALTLKAHWQDPWTITLSDGEAAGASSLDVVSITVKHNTSANAEKPADPTWEGHDFNGWFYGEPATAFNWEANVTQDYTIVAQWITQVARYDVQYYDGETLLGTEEQVRADQHPTATGINTDKSLHSFVCWYTSSTLEGDPVDLNTVTPVEGLKLYGKWNKDYATSVNLKAEAASTEDPKPTYEEVLAAHNISGALTNTSWDTGTDIYNGLKIKGVNSNITFYLKQGQFIVMTVGYANNDVKIEVNETEQSFTSSTSALSYFRYYAASADALIKVTKTANNGTASSIRDIYISDPIVVTYNANDGEDVEAANYTGTALTLPSATKGTDSFLGWFDAAEGGNKIGDVGDSYTPTADIELFAHWEAVSSDARLASISFSSAAGTLSPAFNPEVTVYTYTMPYGTAAIPTITGATSVNANAQAPIIGDAATAWGEAQTIKGVAESGDKKTYTITMLQAPKDGTLLVKAELAPGSSAASISATSGAFKDDANIAINIYKDLKLGGTGNYVKVAVAGTTFQDGDVVEITLASDKNVSAWLQVFADAGTTLVAEMQSGVSKEHPNKLTIANVPANTTSLYLYRTEEADGNMNPYPTSIAVYRAMNPILKAITLDGVEAEKGTGNAFSATLPNGTNLASMTVVPTVIWNGAGTTAPTAAWAWGENTYRVEDKDGDYTNYTIMLTEAAAPSAAPVITAQPVGDDYIEGATITPLEVVATGSGTLTYQWYLGENAIDGATADTYTPTVSAIGTYVYHCVVTNTEAGHPGTSLASSNATITIAEDPSCKGIGYGTANALATTTEVVLDATTGLKHVSSKSTVEGSRKIKDVSNIDGIKLDGGAYYDIYTTEKNIGSVAISMTSNANGTNRKFAVIFCSTASFDATKILGIVEQTGGAGDEVQVVNTPEVPLGTKLVRVMRYYKDANNNEYGEANSSWIYYARVCLVEPAQEVIASVTAEPASANYCPSDVVAALQYDLSIEAGATAAYQWYKGNDAIEGAEDATFMPTETGAYTCKATLTKAGRMTKQLTSAEATVNFYVATAITAYANAAGDVDAEKTISVTAEGTNLSYKWQACDANGIVTDETVLSTTATYDVTITAVPQYYLVTVEGACGTETQVVKAELWVEYPFAHVTGTRTWDWKSSTAGWPTASNSHIDFANTGVEYQMSNVSSQVPNNDQFRSDMLIGKGQYVWRNKSDGEYGFQGFSIKFYTEVVGKVRIYYRAPSSGQTSVVTIDGKNAGSRGNSWGWSNYVVVGAQKEIVIALTNGENGMTRVQKIEFIAEPDINVAEADYTRNVTEGRYGTICLPNGGVMVGADIFTLAYYGESSQKFFFDEVPSGEMEAGKPYLFLPNENIDRIGVYYTDNANETAKTVNGFVGYIGATAEDWTPVPDNGNCYIISNNLYRQVLEGADARILSNRAYINMTGATNIEPAKAPGARRIGLGTQGSQVATDIDNIFGDDTKAQKVLINGQLFIIRGGKMFDATGKLVK